MADATLQLTTLFDNDGGQCYYATMAGSVATHRIARQRW